MTSDALEMLSRALKVSEGESVDRLELVSAWQRIPEYSPNRLYAKMGTGFVVLVAVLLLVQGVITHQKLAFLAAFLMAAGGFFLFWRKRFWFWATILEVSEQSVSLSFRGPWAPAGEQTAIAGIQALIYRTRDGELHRLAISHADGALQLPFSGRRDVDKLYCNLIRHFLQKRRPEIEFKQID